MRISYFILFTIFHKQVNSPQTQCIHCVHKCEGHSPHSAKIRIIHEAFKSKEFFFFFFFSNEPLLLFAIYLQEEEKDGAGWSAARRGEIMSPHQFYLRLALAPVLCFPEPWHFFICQKHREEGANARISCTRILSSAPWSPTMGCGCFCEILVTCRGLLQVTVLHLAFNTLGRNSHWCVHWHTVS